MKANIIGNEDSCADNNSLFFLVLFKAECQPLEVKSSVSNMVSSALLCGAGLGGGRVVTVPVCDPQPVTHSPDSTAALSTGL